MAGEAARVCDELNRVNNQGIRSETIMVHTALKNAFQETLQNILVDSAWVGTASVWGRALDLALLHGSL